MTFAARERLQELCTQAKARGTTQTEIARRIGEGPMWITNRLTGHSQVHADDVPRIAEAFRIDVDSFYNPDRRPFPEGTLPRAIRESFELEGAERMLADYLRLQDLTARESAVVLDLVESLKRNRPQPAA